MLTLRSCLGGDGKVEVSVRDRGVGVTPDKTAEIFDQFYSTKTNGMGLGLAISQSIVEAHRGRLLVSANDDVGMTFKYTLPND